MADARPLTAAVEQAGLLARAEDSGVSVLTLLGIAVGLAEPSEHDGPGVGEADAQTQPFA